MPAPRSELVPALLVLAASAAPFAVAAAAGWPGAPNACVAAGDCFCEAARPGLVRQPANTWSDLGFVVVGLAIGAHAARHRRGPYAPNGMQAGGLYPALYAAIVVFMGPGSMFFHASLTRWGGTLDVLSMYGFVGFWVVYAVARGWRLSRRAFAWTFVGLMVAIGVPQVALGHPSAPVFGPLAAVGLALELLMRRRRRGPAWLPEPAPADGRWLAAGSAGFAAAFALWLPSRTGGPLCDPHSLLQGHAAWHLLSAATPGCFYLYWRSERR
jgi:hypothetical protein